MSVTEETREKAAGDGRGDKQNVGRIEEIQGVVIEAVFPDKLPEINHAIRIRRPVAARAEEDLDVAAERDEWLVCEVQQHLGDDRVLAVAMDMTDGLSRGTEVIDDLTLEMNRARQAEITQEIMEVVAGAEGLAG